ncbi:uncharacterized protein N7477_008819 [Penicillium maclennaniae]|uniref:uncharacterized protein n=1 Tax=Penicillium maclennaniae TaxID=1343394 RepID=UPI0025424D62|nr:uncharacterized protein N7477_008819 [Penicillium maclennaniae]KAJ5666371.1 hypothetical protein N7477_008819 [Penicillium maclennaniae]
MTLTQHDLHDWNEFRNQRTEVLSVLGGGSDKMGDPHAEQFGGVESPLSRPQELRTWTLELRRPFTWTLHSCLQAAIPPGRTDFTMTEKGASSERSAKSKGDAGKDARAKDSPAAKSETSGIGHSSPKKRRKVNHGKVPSRMRKGIFDLLSRFPRLGDNLC